MFKLMGNIQAVPIWHEVSYLKVSTGHTLFLTGTCVGHWPIQPSYFHHCDKYLKHLPGIKGLLWLAISKDLIHGQVGLWTAFGGQWWSTITPLGARMWKKARRRDLGPTMSPRHVTNNTEWDRSALITDLRIYYLATPLVEDQWLSTTWCKDCVPF